MSLSLLLLSGLCSAQVGQAGDALEHPVELIVVPSTVHVSGEYPAQLVAMLRLRDGSLRDCTRDIDTRFEFEQANHLAVDPSGVVRQVDGRSMESTSTSRLVVSHAGLQAVCSVISEVDPAAPPTFAREISAILGKAGCNAGTCHGNLHGKGGLRFSLRGDDPQLDFASLVREAGGRRIDAFSPESSLLLRKPAGLLAHQGGTRFDVDSQSYAWLREWVAVGCPWNAELREPFAVAGEVAVPPPEQLVRIEVLPPVALLADDSREQQLVVLAEFGDGRVRDVTRWARYETSVVGGVRVSDSGLVTAEHAIDVSVGVTYLSGRSASRLTFLPPVATEWDESPPPSRLDALVDEQLRQMRLAPAAVADDTVFLRRAYLAVVGRLPTAEEARQFLSSSSDDKRHDLIESLLFDPGYSMLWALRWSDLLRNEQKVMSSQGAEQWYGWLAEQMSEDRPLSETVHDLVASVGSTYDNPPASFHRTHREPELAAETIGQVFLGVRLQCARCHNHPFDSWRQDDYYGLAAYFSTVERKQLENSPKDKFDKHIISGDELISLNAKPAKIWHPGLAADVPPKPLTVRYDELNAKGAAGAGEPSSPLERLADWLTHENRLFARNMANRIWYHFMGRGIVDPPDDFRDSNPPCNPALLEYLTDELIASNYSARHVARLILTSRTFARCSDASTSLDASPNLGASQNAEEQLDASAMFAVYPLRRMPAEVLYDAVRDATGILPREQRAIAQAETPTTAGFLTAFGKPNRLLVCECERSSEVTLGQSLLLVNGVELREELAKHDNRLGKLLDEGCDDGHIIEELYLTTLARRPSTLERDRMSEYIQRAQDRRAALEDLLWALVNSKEFVLIR